LKNFENPMLALQEAASDESPRADEVGVGRALERGADFDAVNKGQFTPLALAQARRKPSAHAALEQYGRDKELLRDLTWS